MSSVGYIDRQNRLVIQPVYEWCSSFAGGLAAAAPSGQARYGFIDKSGRWVIQPQYDDAWGFSEGLALVCPDVGSGFYGYINTKGEMVIQPQFQQAAGFYDGLARVCLDAEADTWAYIDKKGRRVWVDLPEGAIISTTETTVTAETTATGDSAATVETQTTGETTPLAGSAVMVLGDRDDGHQVTLRAGERVRIELEPVITKKVIAVNWDYEPLVVRETDSGVETMGELVTKGWLEVEAVVAGNVTIRASYEYQSGTVKTVWAVYLEVTD